MRLSNILMAQATRQFKMNATDKGVKAIAHVGTNPSYANLVGRVSDLELKVVGLSDNRFAITQFAQGDYPKLQVRAYHNAEPVSDWTQVGSGKHAQNQHAMAKLDTGFIMTWEESQPNKSVYYWQQFSDTADPASHTVEVGQTPHFISGITNDVAVFEQGGFLIVWQDKISDSGLNYDRLRISRYDATGKRVFTDTLIPEPVSYSINSFRIAVLAHGGFSIVYYQHFNGENTVWLAEYSAKSDLIAQFPLVRADESQYKARVPIAYDPVVASSGNHYATFWRDLGERDHSNIQGQAYWSQPYYTYRNETGVLYKEAKLRPPLMRTSLDITGLLTRSQLVPDSIGLPDLVFVVAWENAGDGSRILMQQLQLTPVTQDEEDRLRDMAYFNATTSLFTNRYLIDYNPMMSVSPEWARGRAPQVADMGNGNYMITWHNAALSSPVGTLFGRKYNCHGTPIALADPGCSAGTRVKIPDQRVELGTPWSLTIPQGIFQDLQNENYTWKAHEIASETLPEGVTFDPESYTFSWTPNATHAYIIIITVRPYRYFDPANDTVTLLSSDPVPVDYYSQPVTRTQFRLASGAANAATDLRWLLAVPQVAVLYTITAALGDATPR